MVNVKYLFLTFFTTLIYCALFVYLQWLSINGPDWMITEWNHDGESGTRFGFFVNIAILSVVVGIFFCMCYIGDMIEKSDNRKLR